MQENRGRGRTERNTYTWTGLGLLVVGAILVLVSMLMLSSLVWLTALGIAMLIMAFIFLALARTMPGVTPEVSMLLLETGIDNIATVIEELGIRSKPVYLPSSLTGGRPQALIPLHSNPSLPKITSTLPQRFIVRYGSGPDDVGLLVTTAIIDPTEILRQSLSLVKSITLAEFGRRILQPASFTRLRGNINLLKEATSQSAQQLLDILDFEYRATERATRNHPAT